MIHLYCINPECFIEFERSVPDGIFIPSTEFDINKKYFCPRCNEELVSESDSEVSKLLWSLGIEEPE